MIIERQLTIAPVSTVSEAVESPAASDGPPKDRELSLSGNWSLSLIMRHIRQVHPHFEGTVRCEVEDCPSTARSYESLRQHMYRKHRNILHDRPFRPRPQRNASPEEIPSGGSSDENLCGTLSVESSTTTHPAEQSDPSLVAAQFILKTRDGRKLTQTATDGILQDTRAILECTIDTLEQKVMRRLEGIDTLAPEDVSEIQSL